MNGTLDTEKRALRAELRERRQQRSAASLEAAAAGVRAQLDLLLAERGVRTMSCFLSTTTEPGTREFIAAAVARGIRVLLPVTRADGLLDWAVAEEDGGTAEAEHALCGAAVLFGGTAEGMFGLPEPTGELLSPVAVNDVDLLVIPAAAVDRTGMRLGWGRGYFDKTIGSMEKCPPVYAVIFDSELLDEVPRDVHDQPVSGVVTPTRTLPLPTR